MKMSRTQEHFLVSLLLGVLYWIIVGAHYAYHWWIVPVAILGGLVPDWDQKIGLGHRKPLMHSFLIPTVLTLVLPQNPLVKSLFLGYGAHMVSDLDNPDVAWHHVKRTTGIALLWVSAILIILFFFDVSLYQILAAL